MGSDTIDSIIINTVVPVLFSYGVYHKEDQNKDKALQWLEDIAAEKNTITKGFSQVGIKAGSAYDTQALLELKNEYCSAKKCLAYSVCNSPAEKRNNGSRGKQ